MIGNIIRPFLYIEFNQEIEPIILLDFLLVKVNGEDKKYNFNFQLLNEKDYLNNENENYVRSFINKENENRSIFIRLGDGQSFPTQSFISIFFAPNLVRYFLLF